MSQADEDFIRVCIEEGSEFVEFPKEDDNTVLLSTLQSQFPTAIGLRYRGSSGAWRSLRVEENVLTAPKEGWSDRVYCVTINDAAVKRKADDSNSASANGGGGGGDSKRSKVSLYLQDMAVMNLPFTASSEDLKEYFEKQFGELDYCEVKKYRDTGKSRGYGFVRFKDEESAKLAVEASHHLDGRKIELKLKQLKPMKLFIGRVPDNTTTSQLEEYFSKFGTLTDVYIPKPFRNFAFITYASSEDGKAVIDGYHEMDGRRLNVMERKTPETAQAEVAAGDRGGRDRGGYGNKPSNQFNMSSSTNYTSRSYDAPAGGGAAGGAAGGYSYAGSSAYSAPTAAPGGGGGGGAMDSDLKKMLLQYLSSQ